jgi:hypothetical protein
MYIFKLIRSDKKSQKNKETWKTGQPQHQEKKKRKGRK